MYLASIGAAGLVVRVIACYLARNHLVSGDAFVYEAVGRSLAQGDDITLFGEPTAQHPPLWEVVLGGADLVGVNGTLSHRLIGAVLGTLTVVLLGLLGRRLGGNSVGLVAAGIAAVYPPLWAADASLMSESLYGAILVGALLAATYRRPIVLGGLIAIAALSRVEALGLVVVLAVPLFWRQWRKVAMTVVACAVVIAPWTIRNVVTFDRPVLISSNSGASWIGTNCDATYYTNFIGSWNGGCEFGRQPGEDEAGYAARETSVGQHYMIDHAGRVPAVLGVRFLRLLDVWNPAQSVGINDGEGRMPRYAKAGIAAFWVLVPFAIGGAAILSRRRDPNLVILVPPIVLVVAVALMLYGSTRMRFGAEPSLVVLAAVALVTLGGRLPPIWQRIRRRLPCRFGRRETLPMAAIVRRAIQLP
jgi:4-amino-4-deoxy-L-arabinose transferase-like glycosyltransferase